MQLSLSGVVVFLISIYFLFFYSSEIHFYPQKDKKILFFDDSYNNGNSKIVNTNIKSDAVSFTCILNNGFEYPYAGADISLPENNFIDLSSKNSIEIKLNAKNCEHFIFYLLAKDSNVNDPKFIHGLRRYSLDIHYEKNDSIYVFDLNEFKTPLWWFNSIKQNKNEFEELDLRQFSGVIITPGVNPNLNSPITISVQSVKFYKNNSYIILTLVILFVIIFLSMFYFFIKKRDKTTEKVLTINYSPIIVQNKQVNYDEEIVKFINQNFENPELSSEMISKNVGVNAKFIANVMSEQFNCNLKTYINQIRIAEAKKLLLQNQLPINEIAELVGFTNVANFNRVFKKFENVNPTEFVLRSK